MALKLKNILEEIKINGETIGFVDDFGKVAVLKPKESIGEEHQPMYNQKVA